MSILLYISARCSVLFCIAFYPNTLSYTYVVSSRMQEVATEVPTKLPLVLSVSWNFLRCAISVKSQCNFSPQRPYVKAVADSRQATRVSF